MNNIKFYQFDKIIKFIDYRGKTPHKTDNGITLITAKNIKFGYLSEEPKECISETAYDAWMTRGIPRKGDVLFTTEAPLGNVCILDTNDKRAFAQRVIVFQAINNDIYISKYLFYYLMSPIFLIELNLNKTGTTVKGIKSSILKKFKIPLPPVTEQKRIVQKLDALFERIDKAIALLQKNIDAADNFMNSVLNDVFSDLEQNYGTQPILDGINIGARAGYKPRLIDGKVPFIGMSDIDDKSGINTRYILEDYEKVSKGKVKFEKNAVLVGKITPCAQNNKTTIVPAEIDGGFATTEVYALHSKENMYPFYLNYFMRSKKVNDYLVSTMVGATGRQRVPSESIRVLNIAIPPMFIQEKVVLYFDNISAQIEQVKSAQQQKMQNLLNLKSSILDQAFHGKL